MAFENLKSTGIKYLLEKLKTVFLQIADAVKSVNGEEPDENGNITINSVPYAQNLESESSNRNYGTFVQRMAGGDGSVSDGDSWLMSIRGNSEHDGYIEESLDMAVNTMPDSPITAAINRDEFVEVVAESGTITLTYSTDWSEDPAGYGVTVTGTPVAGDNIVITYVKEERGEIAVSNPQNFIATGWNLFNYTNGYAKVVIYPFGYRVAGTYTKLQYSATLSGTKTDIPVTDGNFDIPNDGYVWVTGGNSTDTVIYATWEDWTEEPESEYQGYTESEVDLSNVMATYFPNGLLKAGAVYDEIDLNLGQAISRVERMTYSEANRAIAANTGRDYEFDEDYIYLAKATASISSIAIDGSFISNDHGIEWFTQTEVPVYAEALYGANLKNKLERDVLTISAQMLSESQKEQARNNIGAAKDDPMTVTQFKFNNSDLTCVWKFGRICFLSCVSGTWYNSAAGGNIRLSSASGTQWTLPADCYPIQNVEVKEPNYEKRITITKGGNITCSTLVSGSNLRFSACWITKE